MAEHPLPPVAINTDAGFRTISPTTRMVARIRRLDTSRAAALPGVAAVLTARDVPRNTLWTDVPGQTSEVGALRTRLQVFAERVVRFEGEPVALVAAETPEAVRCALDAIEVDYEVQPGALT